MKHLQAPETFAGIKAIDREKVQSLLKKSLKVHRTRLLC